MSDEELRAHLAERWRQINWLAVWRMIGVFRHQEVMGYYA